MKEFYTRKKSNEGVKLPLVFPDGSPSKHWLLVRSIQSDAFREIVAEDSRRQILNSSVEKDEDKVTPATHTELLCTLIAGWSFEQECTDENKHKFLTEAPQVADEIDKFAANKKRFFSKPSKGSINPSEKNLL